MTLPFERYRAVKYAREFLLDLLNPKVTPRVPKSVRKEAHRVLRHFPLPFEMDMAAQQAPELFATRSLIAEMEEKNKAGKYGGFEGAEQDIIIDGCRLICTCSVCPEQYDVFNNDTGAQLGYLRLRHGWFRADCPDVGGETVYEAHPQGDGCFEDSERTHFLTLAVAQIKNYWTKLRKEYGDEAKE